MVRYSTATAAASPSPLDSGRRACRGAASKPQSAAARHRAGWRRRRLCHQGRGCNTGPAAAKARPPSKPPSPLRCARPSRHDKKPTLRGTPPPNNVPAHACIWARRPPAPPPRRGRVVATAAAAAAAAAEEAAEKPRATTARKRTHKKARDDHQRKKGGRRAAREAAGADAQALAQWKR